MITCHRRGSPRLSRSVVSPAIALVTFQATLEELAEADLLLHIVDITHADAAHQSQTVDDTLAELGLTDHPRITALNKVDLLVKRDGGSISNLDELADYDLSLAEQQVDAVLISAERGWGLEGLLARIDEKLSQIEGERAQAASRRESWSDGVRHAKAGS